MRSVIIAVCLLAMNAAAQTSHVATVKGWKRTHVLGLPGGTLRDPTGTLADAQRLAAVQAMNTASTGLVAAAEEGLNDALGRLYDAAERTNDFTGRLYVAADLDSDPEFENLESHVVRETYEAGTVNYFVHYNRDLTAPPKTIWRFSVEESTAHWASGIAPTNNATTNVNGYACYHIKVQRPAAAAGAVLRTHKFLHNGAPGTPLDIAEAGLAIIRDGATNYPFAGDIARTNGAEIVTRHYKSGMLHTVATNTLEGL